MSDVPIRIGDHAAWQALRRGIDQSTVIEVASRPQQIVPVRPGREIRQSRSADGRYLIRVVVDVTDDEAAVVTMYGTSKVDRHSLP